MRLFVAVRPPGACRLTGTAVHGAWDVEEVELVASRPGPDGAVHEVLGRFATRPTGGA